jgi:transcriptional regulator GlxA family with amidase domain
LATDIPIGHIASRCGMQSDSFLKRFFKARTGLTLREWRNRQMRLAQRRRA